MILCLLSVDQYGLLNTRDLSKLRQDVHSVLDCLVRKRLQWLNGTMGKYTRGEPLAAAVPGPSIGQAASPSGSPLVKRPRVRSA